MSTGIQHWLLFDNVRQIVGCQCGFDADPDEDCGWGEAVVRHLLAVGWDDGYASGYNDGQMQALAPNAGALDTNPYREAVSGQGWRAWVQPIARGLFLATVFAVAVRWLG